MSQQIRDTLESSEIVYITTFDRNGASGTVPVWFLIQEADVFITI